MSKRASIESKVVEFFSSAPLEAAEVVLGIVAPMVRARRKQLTPGPVQTKPRVKRAKKANATSASPSTSFETSTLSQ